MECNNCGGPNADGAHFCAHCGQPLVASGSGKTQDAATQDGARESVDVEELVRWIVAKTDRHHGTRLSTDAQAMERLRKAAAHAVDELERTPEVHINVPFIAASAGGPVHIDEHLTRTALRNLFAASNHASYDWDQGGTRDEPEVSRRDDDGERERESERLREAARRSSQRATAIVGGVMAVSVVAAVFIAESSKHKKESKSKESAAHRSSGHGHDDDSTPTTTTATTTATADPIRLLRVPSCTCLSRGNSAKDTFVLQAPPNVTDPTWFFRWSHVSGFTSMSSGFTLHGGDAGTPPVLPPAAGATKLRMALGCDGDIVTLVSGKIASGWAGNDHGELIWNTKLPAELAPVRTATVPVTSVASYDVACTRVLTITAGLASLDLANGKHVSLSMRDGTLH